MSQNCLVMAFRKRLSFRGYKSIRIYHLKDNLYLVSALEPLAGVSVSVELTDMDMYHMFR